MGAQISTLDSDNEPASGAKLALLSGGSGVLGSAIAADLKRNGWRILSLVRRPAKGADEISWNPGGGTRPAIHSEDLARLGGVTAAIHLSGANVAKRRWTAAYKKEIAASRLESTAALARTLAQLANPPEALVSASAIGYYGDRGDQVLDENSSPGKGFFPELCEAWEQAALPASQAGIRVVHPRFGVVLGPKGGALAQMRPLFQLGLGGRLGSGKQWMSWISETDAVAALVFALSNSSLAGPINIVSPQPVTNSEFTSELAEALHRPAILPAPAFALRLAFGEMADEALLSSARVLPKRLSESGFHFTHPTLSSALQAILRAR